MSVIIFVWFLFGIIIGYLYYDLFCETSIKHIAPHKRVIDSEPNNNTLEEVKKIRILCFLHTSPKMHSLRAVHIKQTWGRHCDKLLFSSSLTDVNLDAIGFNVSNDHEHMWGKVKLMMQFVHTHFINDYDWFIKGDDDMFLITENLRYMLSAYSTYDPIYFGYKFYTEEHKWGYFSGGSGYVMSRKAVRTFVEEILTNEEFFGDPAEELGCRIDTDERVEDWDISLCLDFYNIYAGDSRDLLKRERFIIWGPEEILFKTPYYVDWYWERKYYFSDEGLDCCSNYTVSFHYIQAKYQYTLFYLIYRLQPYGIKSQFSPPPMKRNFTEVKTILDLERFNKTLRGY